ncbi:hypothetical protein [Antarcticirhabdus aurantiaca]|uniref:hypothetical protein n=1 Tax=Antarcticirhabdus aurantiaca TaxID=2606717 RepID=UPI00131D712E|nr:hypothetical protein [Antarcticirhabdus aurantiaca]
MKNKLVDLNNHLFAQLERLGEEGLTAEQIEAEARRAEAMTGVADQVVRLASLSVSAAKLVVDYGNDPAPYLRSIEGKRDE